MVHFRFPIRQLPIALQDFATDMETIVDQVFHQGDCQGDNGVLHVALPKKVKPAPKTIEIKTV